MLKRLAIQTEKNYLLNFACFKITTLKGLNYKKQLNLLLIEIY